MATKVYEICGMYVFDSEDYVVVSGKANFTSEYVGNGNYTAGNDTGNDSSRLRYIGNNISNISRSRLSDTTSTDFNLRSDGDSSNKTPSYSSMFGVQEALGLIQSPVKCDSLSSADAANDEAKDGASSSPDFKSNSSMDVDVTDDATKPLVCTTQSLSVVSNATPGDIAGFTNVCSDKLTKNSSGSRSIKRTFIVPETALNTVKSPDVVVQEEGEVVDVFYDTPDYRLTLENLCLFRRNEIWFLQTSSGNFSGQTSNRRVSDEEELIGKLVARLNSRTFSDCDLREYNLKEFFRYGTRFRRLLLDGCVVRISVTDFGRRTGTVELLDRRSMSANVALDEIMRVAERLGFCPYSPDCVDVS